MEAIVETNMVHKAQPEHLDDVVPFRIRGCETFRPTNEDTVVDSILPAHALDGAAGELNLLTSVILTNMGTKTINEEVVRLCERIGWHSYGET